MTTLEIFVLSFAIIGLVIVLGLAIIGGHLVYGALIFASKYALAHQQASALAKASPEVRAKLDPTETKEFEEELDKENDKIKS